MGAMARRRAPTYGKATDRNQRDLVRRLNEIPGVSCRVIHQPVDLLVGYRNRNYLMEVKRDQKAVLTPDQVEFFEAWKGQVVRVHSFEEAAAILGIKVSA